MSVFAAATAWVVYLGIFNYFEYDIVTKLDVINQRPADFPVITICNSNPFTTKGAQDLISNIAVSNYGIDIDNFTTDQAYNRRN